MWVREERMRLQVGPTRVVQVFSTQIEHVCSAIYIYRQYYSYRVAIALPCLSHSYRNMTSRVRNKLCIHKNVFQQIKVLFVCRSWRLSVLTTMMMMWRTRPCKKTTWKVCNFPVWIFQSCQILSTFLSCFLAWKLSRSHVLLWLFNVARQSANRKFSLHMSTWGKYYRSEIWSENRMSAAVVAEDGLRDGFDANPRPPTACNYKSLNEFTGEFLSLIFSSSDVILPISIIHHQPRCRPSLPSSIVCVNELLSRSPRAHNRELDSQHQSRS